MPIGGVLAAKNYIIPNAVGVDIGCGVLAAKLNLTADTFAKDSLKAIMDMIRVGVPVGMKHNDMACDESKMPQKTIDCNLIPVVHQEYQSARRQLGTLGGGNHFIEIQRGDDGFIWFMIHSGSRNLGKKVCDFYNKKAKELNEKWCSSVHAKHDLAFLPYTETTADCYIAEMNYCLEFAEQNRAAIAEKIVGAFSCVMKMDCEPVILDVHHNYAALENHFGSNVWVHRKGAICARKEMMGIIPGSQGTKSYIVRGKGNPNSFMSCSHGAGRKMGRTEARNNLDLQEQIDLMNAQGIVHGIRNKEDLDEAPGSYKDIDVVIREQEDLVEVVTELTPLGVIKA
jgi:tRNA-splicing ligase RtcB